MGLIEQVNQMKTQGIEDGQIVNQLQQQGNAPADIQNALGQLQVKNAVAGGQQAGDPQLQVPELPEQQPVEQEQPQEQYSPNPNQYDSSQQGQEQYPQQPQEYGYAGGTDNTLEIAQQVVLEATQKIQQQLSKMQEFKTLTENQIQNLNKRLESIENSFDKMQAAILEKVGSYGNNLGQIQKEMSMMQESFGKVVNTALDKKTHSRKSSKKR